LATWLPALIQTVSQRLPQSMVMILLSAFVLTGLASVSGQAMAQGQAQPTLQKVVLKIAKKTLQTEMAITPNQRYMGLSFRKSMAEDEAMLFVFPTEQPLTFTMRNTLIPLSIAYISADLLIQEIHTMPVGPNQLFPSKAPAQFALEVNQGWFERNNVDVGDKISISR